MKKTLFIALIIASTFTTYLFSSTPMRMSLEKEKMFIENLLEGINSDNTGLKISSAYFLGEMKSEKALLSLMSMLKTGGTEGERIIAALSLIKLGNEKGLFAVKQRIVHDPSPFVRQMCKQFYTAHLNGSVEY